MSNERDIVTVWESRVRAGEERARRRGTTAFVRVPAQDARAFIDYAAGQAAEITRQTDELTAFRAECDKVGIPYDPPGLVRHHRGNAGLAAASEALAQLLAAEERVRQLTEVGTELLALKDGPRDEAYRAAKDGAWQRLRAALAAGQPQPGDTNELAEQIRDDNEQRESGAELGMGWRGPAVEPQTEPVPNQVRPSDVLVVGARITNDVIDLVRKVEGALVAAVIAAVVADRLAPIAAAVPVVPQPQSEG